MQTSSALEQVVLDAARREYGDDVVLRVEVRDFDTASDPPLLLFRLVMKPDAVEGLAGDTILDANLRMSRAVQKTGESNPAVFEYVDLNELDALGRH